MTSIFVRHRHHPKKNVARFCIFAAGVLLLLLLQNERAQAIFFLLSCSSAFSSSTFLLSYLFPPSPPPKKFIQDEEAEKFWQPATDFSRGGRGGRIEFSGKVGGGGGPTFQQNLLLTASGQRTVQYSRTQILEQQHKKVTSRCSRASTLPTTWWRQNFSDRNWQSGAVFKFKVYIGVLLYILY